MTRRLQPVCIAALVAACGPAPTVSDADRAAPVPAGWRLSGPATQFRAVADRRVAHGGRASARLESTAPDPDGAGTLMQSVPAEPYRGKRVRLAGFLATDGVTGWTGLWMRVVRPRGGADAFDNMQDRALHGTTTWARYSVVLDVAVDAVALEIGVVQDGPGASHLDDVSLDVVGPGVAVTGIDRRLQRAPDGGGAVAQPGDAAALAHGGFDDEAALRDAWFLSGGGRAQYEAVLDRTVKYAGSASGQLRPRVASPRGYGVLIQAIPAGPYRDQRLRLTAAVKTADAHADLWARVQAATSNPDGPGLSWTSHRLAGTTDWRSYELVFEVPPDGDAIEIGAGLRGRGALWIDDVHLDVVSTAVALTPTNAPAGAGALINGGFEAAPGEPGQGEPDGWSMSGGAQAEFEVAIDRAEHVAGAASARLRPRVAAPSGYGTLMQSIAADRYRGKRLRMTAFVKGQGITGRGDLWLRVQAAYSPGDGPGLGGGSCRLAHSFAWKSCELVFDVPEAGEAIQLGIGLAGPGTVWLDQVSLDEVARDVPVTAVVRAGAQPVNLDFEAVD